MCAIFGIVGDYDEQKALRGVKLLKHRGEDFCGVSADAHSFLAHQRLSITDISSSSNQPFVYKNIKLLFNGEIYNYKELKKELDFEFKTSGDTEVVLASYLRWGVDFVNHLRGMFAIAILDGDELFLFRDRLGKKPLFYMQQGRSFYFASEIKALRFFQPKTELNDDALMSYLTFLAPTPPHTFYKGINKLSSGSFVRLKGGKVEVKSYYNILDVTPNTITNKDEAVSVLESVLKESIDLRLKSDVKMASLLSGGIDSATINYYGKGLQTYTLGYKGFSKYDETQNAKQTAEFLHVENKMVQIDEDDFVSAMYDVLDTLDEPLNDPASIPLYLLFKEIKKDGYKVVLSGEGSDELFLGYRQYFEYLDIEKASELLHKNWLKKYFRSNFSMNREWEWYKRVFDGSLLFRTSGEKFTDMQKNILMKRNVRDDESLKYLQPYLQNFTNSNHSDHSIWYSYIDLNIFQAEHFLTKLDRVSMAHGIESRTPFLDHKLVESVFKISPKLRYEDGVTKSLLKQMMSNKLSDEILNRKKKGFSNPYMEYLINSGEINLITKVNKKTALFKDDVLEKYIQMAKKGRFKQHTWGLFVLSYWLESFMV